MPANMFNYKILWKGFLSGGLVVAGVAITIFSPNAVYQFFGGAIALSGMSIVYDVIMKHIIRIPK